MKTKCVLVFSGFLLLAVQQANAQSKAKKTPQEIVYKKAEREKRIAQIRKKVNEQKAQLQYERRPDAGTDIPLPAVSNAGGVPPVATDSAAAFRRRAGQD